MKYDFDAIYDRGNTDSLKWRLRAEHCGSEDVIPLWVADMDFACPPEVAEAVQARAAHPIYGYPLRSEGYYRSVIGWMRRRNGWEIEKDWICYTPGIVPGMNFAVQACTKPGDKVVIQPPVYHPFTSAVLNNGRQLVENPLVIENGRYVMDYAGLERVIDDRTRAIIISSPHNPVGRVGKGRTERLAEICARRGLAIICDEIHSDLILDGPRHTCLASISREAAEITITLSAPNKTFNIAGLTMGNAIIADERLRAAFSQAVENSGIGVSNVFGNVALEAAYDKGEPWLEEMLEYLRGNYRLLAEAVAERLPELKLCPLEGTYLAWIDFNALGMSDAELARFLTRDAKVWLDEGTKFGNGGSGFMRMNLACPRAYIVEALARIEKAVAARR